VTGGKCPQDIFRSIDHSSPMTTQRISLHCRKSGLIGYSHSNGPLGSFVGEIRSFVSVLAAHDVDKAIILTKSASARHFG